MNLSQAWYEQKWWLYFFAPLTLIYSFIISIRRALYRCGVLKSTRFKFPVIIVGNLTVGGTGKTPLTIALAHYLAQNGYKPGIVSRGYGGKAKHYPILVNANSDAQTVGDEALLMARNVKCPLVIDPNRVNAVDYLVKNTDCNIILSDDGLQHYALQRDIEIIVIDGYRRFGNAWQLPTGPLRESLTRLKKAKFLVVNGIKYNPDEYLMQLVGNEIRSVAHPEVKQPLSIFQGKTIHAVAGIGNPEQFFNALQKLGFAIVEHVFPDHYEYKKNDLDFGEEAIIIMTEKDAVKCQALVDYQAWYLPVTATVESDFYTQLMTQLKLGKQYA